MGPAADRAEPVQGGHADPGGKVPVRRAADRGARQPAQSQAAATAVARANSGSAAEAGNGGRFGPPETEREAPARTGRSDRIAASTRSCSAAVHIRPSTVNDPLAGTVLIVVPADSIVGVTVVPAAAEDSAATAWTWCASSIVAFTPRSGSSPACAARPAAVTVYRDVPLRAVFSVPPSAAASRMSAARQPPAADSISARDVGDPISSSPVTSSVTPAGSSSAARAWNASTRPDFMSKHPGPRRIPSDDTENGWVSSDPRGQTVSWWASTSTDDGPDPKSQRRCEQPSTVIRDGAKPSRRSPSSATTDADRATALRSADGDSARTSVPMLSTIAWSAPSIARISEPELTVPPGPGRSRPRRPGRGWTGPAGWPRTPPPTPRPGRSP